MKLESKNKIGSLKSESKPKTKELDKNISPVFSIQNSITISFSASFKKSQIDLLNDKDLIYMKMLQINPYDKKKIIKLFKEYEIINQLHHPNIIKILGYFEGDELMNPAILLEYHSTKIKEMIKQLRDVYLVSIIYEICHAMMSIHSKKLIHQNLNTDCIFIDSKKHAIIGNFGESSLISKREQIEKINGQPFCVSQEILQNREFNEKVDVFAFGIIMLFILQRGEGPFLSKEEIEAGKKAIIKKEINKISFKIISKCLSHSPEERPSFKEIIQKIEKSKFNLIDGIESQIQFIQKHLNSIICKKV